MSRYKRVYSFWKTAVKPIGVTATRDKVINERRLRPILMKKYGSRLVIVDEKSRELEHCGGDVTAAQLRKVRARTVTMEGELPEAVREVFDLPVAEEAAKPKRSRKKSTTRKKTSSRKKPAAPKEEAPAEEPEVTPEEPEVETPTEETSEDPNPFE